MFFAEEFDEEEEEEEVDLNSLIEGGVDDDDVITEDDEASFYQQHHHHQQKQQHQQQRHLAANSQNGNSKSKMVLPEMESGSLRRPPRPQLTIVDDLDEDLEEDVFGEEQELVIYYFVLSLQHSSLVSHSLAFSSRVQGIMFKLPGGEKNISSFVFELPSHDCRIPLN